MTNIPRKKLKLLGVPELVEGVPELVEGGGKDRDSKNTSRRMRNISNQFKELLISSFKTVKLSHYGDIGGLV